MYKLNDFLKQKGYDTNDIELMEPYLIKWASWYQNNVPSFHNYYEDNGERKIRMKRYSTGIAKKICEDYANLLLNEKATFKIGNDKENELINKILDSNDFYELANSSIERTFALGTGAFVLSLSDILYDEETDKYSFDNSKLVIEFAGADKIKPLTFRNNKIEECAFAVERVINGKHLLYVTIHKKNEIGNYVIENYLFKIGKAGGLIDISDSIEDTFRVFDTQNNLPWFSIFRPATENCIFENSPFGMSVYANSIDLLKGVDIAYDSFINEMVLGRKRIFVATEALKPDLVTGEIRLAFDPYNSLYQQLQLDADGKTIIKEIDMNLRISELEQATQLALNLLSENVGLGNGYYKFDKEKSATATEIISKNSELFRSLHKHEIRIENCLYDLFKSICYIARTFLGLVITEDPEVSIDFDDSIFEDKKEIKNTAILELNNGLISPLQYYQKVYNMTEEQSIEYYQKVQKNLSEDVEDEESPEEE